MLIFCFSLDLRNWNKRYEENLQVVLSWTIDIYRYLDTLFLSGLHKYIVYEKVYHVLLRFLVDPDFVNQRVKLDLRITCTLEANVSKLFESNRQVSYNCSMCKIIYILKDLYKE